MSRNLSLTGKLVAAQAQRLPNLLKDDKYGSAEQIMSLPVPKLVALLRDPGASVYARAKACQRLAVVGDGSAVPAIAPLLADEHLAVYARFALEPLPDPAADDALRAALPKLNGILLVGVINSIGRRRDKKALPMLEKLRYNPDHEVVRAADVALARIRPAL